MAIGGFGGGDPSPTLAQFQTYVAEGQIHYYVSGGNRGGGVVRAEDGSATQIATWVAANFTATTVDGVTLYDLTRRSDRDDRATRPGRDAEPGPPRLATMIEIVVPVYNEEADLEACGDCTPT